MSSGISALSEVLVSGEAVKMKTEGKRVTRVLTNYLTHNVVKL